MLYLALLNGALLIAETFEVLLDHLHITDHLLVALLIALLSRVLNRPCEHVACRALLELRFLTLGSLLLAT